MKSTSDHEKIFFNYFVANPQYLKDIGKGFFANSDIDAVSAIAREFYLKYAESPSENQMKVIIDDNALEISKDIVSAIYSINLNDYDQDWLKRTTEAWVKWKHFDKHLIKTIEYVKTQTVSPENVEEVVNKAINMISSDGSISFDADVGLDFYDVNSHKQDSSKKISTGWDYVDRITNGGYDTKSLIVYAGEQNIGKCLIYDTIINIRNKKTGQKQAIKIGDFFNLVKSSR